MAAHSTGKQTSTPTRFLIVLALETTVFVGAMPSLAQQKQTRTGDVTATFPPPDNSPQTQSGSLDSPQDDARSPERPTNEPKHPPAAPTERDADQQAPRNAQPQRTPQSDSELQAEPRLPPQQPPADGQMEGRPDRPSQNHATQGALPDTLTLPEGTVIRIRVDDWLSTDHNVIGDTFSGSLEDPIVVDGWVVARRGQAQTGHVSQVKKGGHGSGNSQLGLDLPELTLADGQKLNLRTDLNQTSGSTSHGRDAAVVGTTTGIGAVIGGIVGRGVGAVIGAGVGATAGIIGVISGPGKPAAVPAETVISFRLEAPVTISTDKNQYAFQPVKQSDYESHTTENRPRMRRPGPPPPRYGGPYGYPAYPPPPLPRGSGYYAH